jgi:peptidoglycan/LPS O-acetylase OafA/YrhL
MRETRHVAYLDGWRGGAILLLLAGHFSLVPTISGYTFYTARLGVECFFVLSGRLMAEILFVRENPLGLFYWRRISRIFPALWVFVLSLLLLSQFYPGVNVTVASALRALTFMANYYTPGGPLEHVWSLCVEEHAYIFLSLVALLYRKSGVNPVLVLSVMAAACALNGMIQTWGFHRDYYDVYWHSDVRMASVFMSAALYLSLRNSSVHPSLPLIALLVGFFLHRATMPDPVKYTAGTFLLSFSLATLHCTWPVVLKALGHPIMTHFGIWSFSLYLWQQPFYMLQSSYSRPLLLAAVAVCALASFYLVERPARRLLNSMYPAPANPAGSAAPA